MKKWLAGLGILGLSVLTLAACGNKSDGKASGEKQTITVATDSDTAPFTFKKGDDFKGYDIDLVKAIFKDSDKYEVKFVTTPFDSILTGVDSGRYQIAANDSFPSMTILSVSPNISAIFLMEIIGIW